MPPLSDSLSVGAAVLVSVASSGAIILALSSWLGRVWAERIAERERAKFARDLEQYRSELSELVAHRQDFVIRRRAVYTSLATSLRVFLGSPQPATDEEKRTFLRAYDESCLWSTDEVAETVGVLLDALRANFVSPGSIPQPQLQDLYGGCILAMRRDSGFRETNLKYRVVRFDK